MFHVEHKLKRSTWNIGNSASKAMISTGLPIVQLYKIRHGWPP